MTDQTQEPTVNGVPVSALPGYAQKMFDKIMSLREKEANLQTQLVQTRGALEELANMLAQEVEDFKASVGTVSTAAPAPIQTTDPTAAPST